MLHIIRKKLNRLKSPGRMSGKRPGKALCAALALVTSLSMTGCSVGDSVTITTNSSTTNVSVSWWGNDPRHEYTLAGLDLFGKQNPDISISPSYGIWNGYERRYQIMMLSNSETDVMQINYAWLNRYSPEGDGYYDLSTLSDVIDLDNYTEDDLNTGTVNGHLIALPIAYNTTVLFYNKDLYDSYGLDIPESWDDLIKAAKIMSKDGVYPVGMEAKQLFLLLNAWFEQNNDKKLFDKEGHYTGDADDMKAILDFYKKLVDEKVLPAVSEYDLAFFINNQSAGVACWVSDAASYCKDLTEGGVSIVVGDRLHSEKEYCSGWYVKPATMYCISKNCEDPAAAGRLLNFLVSSPDMARLQGTEKGVPVNRTAMETLRGEGMIDSIEYDASSMIRENQDELQMMLPQIENSEVLSCFTDCSAKYLFGVASLEDAAEELDKRIAETVPRA